MTFKTDLRQGTEARPEYHDRGLCFFGGGAPSAPAPPPAPPVDTSAADEERRKTLAAAGRRRGRAADILTGATGDTSAAPTAMKVLLGQ